MSRVVNITLTEAVHVGEVRSFDVVLWANEFEAELEDISLWNTFEYTLKRYVWEDDPYLTITDIDKDVPTATVTINLSAEDTASLPYGVYLHTLRRTDNPETVVFTGYLVVKPA